MMKQEGLARLRRREVRKIRWSRGRRNSRGEGKGGTFSVQQKRMGEKEREKKKRGEREVQEGLNRFARKKVTGIRLRRERRKGPLHLQWK